MLDEKAGDDWSFVETCLIEVVAKKDPSDPPIVVVIDGWDEAAGANVGLPRDLPAGVFLCLTGREVPRPVLRPGAVADSEVLTIRADDARHAEDVALYLRDKLPDVALREQLLERSENNLMYLAYVLSDLARGVRLDIRELPRGLDGYYGGIWKAIEAELVCERSDSWRRTLLTTIELLAAAQEPVSSSWLARMLSTTAGEDNSADVERALDHWRRFLVTRGPERAPLWSLIHKSFADYLARYRTVRLASAHARIADAALLGWGGLDAGLPRLEVASQGRHAQDAEDTYACRHVAAHLVRAGRGEDLLRLLKIPEWQRFRRGTDGSERPLQRDWEQLWEAAARRREEAPGATRLSLHHELLCVLAASSMNGILAGTTPGTFERFVDAGWWSTSFALAAVRECAVDNVAGAWLSAIAPHLSLSEVARALRFPVAEASPRSPARRALLERLANLEPEMAVEEAEKEELADVVRWLGNRVPKIWVRREVDSALTRGIAAKADLKLLTTLLPHVPDEQLPNCLAFVRYLDTGKDASGLLCAIAARLAESQPWDEIVKFVMGIHDSRCRGDVWASLLCRVPLKERDRFLSEALPEVCPKRLAVLAISGAYHPGMPFHQVLLHLDRTARHHLLMKAVSCSGDVRFIAKALAQEPRLVDELSSDVLDAAKSALRHDDASGIAAVATLYAMQGDFAAALATCKLPRDSYDRHGAILTMLPALAWRNPEAAVRIALEMPDWSPYHQGSKAVAAVAPLVGQEHLSGLAARAIGFEENPRRRALQAIAEGHARAGDREAAFALLRRIDDNDEVERFRAAISVCHASLAAQSAKALDLALALTSPLRRIQTLEEIAGHLASADLVRACDAIQKDKAASDEKVLRHYALRALLKALCEQGAAEDAWSIAEGESWDENGAGLRAMAAAYLSEPVAQHRFQWLFAIHPSPPTDDDYPNSRRWLRYMHIKALAPHLRGPVLHRLVMEASGVDGVKYWQVRGDIEEAAAVRLAETGEADAALDLALSSEAFFCTDYPNSPGSRLIAILDRYQVRRGLEALAADGSRLGRDGWQPALLARLAELGYPRVALACARENRSERMWAAVVAVTPHLPEVLVRTVVRQAEEVIDTWKPSDPDSDARRGARTALVAAASRLCHLDLADEALDVAQRHDLPEALKAIGAAPSLDREDRLTQALELLRWNTSELAQSGLLPRLAARGGRSAVEALSLALEMWGDHRKTALRDLVPALLRLPVRDAHSAWSQATRGIADKQRPEALPELATLLPLAFHLNGPDILEDVEEALREACELWP